MARGFPSNPLRPDAGRVHSGSLFQAPPFIIFRPEEGGEGAGAPAFLFPETIYLALSFLCDDRALGGSGRVAVGHTQGREIPHPFIAGRNRHSLGGSEDDTRITTGRGGGDGRG